ncbi:unnamed protein product, partial [Aphanomyces euteiches]
TSSPTLKSETSEPEQNFRSGSCGTDMLDFRIFEQMLPQLEENLIAEACRSVRTLEPLRGGFSRIIYMALFHHLAIPQKTPTTTKKSVLILNGAGGVGSIAIQLLKTLTDVTIIATASRPQSTAWGKELGADDVVNHAGDIPTQLKDIGIPQVDYILNNTYIEPYFDAIVEVTKPLGKISSIIPPLENLPLQNLFHKSVIINWECMFTRSLYTTDNIVEQHRLLNHVSELVDAKKIRSTATDSLGKINAENLKKGHAAIETGRSVGKMVLAGF